jgi:hypothetical protein
LPLVLSFILSSWVGGRRGKMSEKPKKGEGTSNDKSKLQHQNWTTKLKHMCVPVLGYFNHSGRRWHGQEKSWHRQWFINQRNILLTVLRSKCHRLGVW